LIAIEHDVPQAIDLIVCLSHYFCDSE